MNILVTGGAGHIGSVTTAWLLEQGHGVRVLDLVPEGEMEAQVAQQLARADYRQVDLSDFAAVQDCCQEVDAIVHLAGIPHLIAAREAEIFGVNAGGTFNVYQAAADAGIRRLVCASSINALGNGFGIRWVDIKYFPIDEAHPGHSTDAYSFSKQILEEIAAYFWRRDGISSACLRFPFVYDPKWFPAERLQEMVRRRQEAYARLMALPPSARRSEIDGLMAEYLDLRSQRSRGEITFRDVFQFLQERPAGSLLFGADDFWAALHVRDAALAIEKALLADYEGSFPLYVADTHNSAGLPSRDLAALFYPDVKTWKRAVDGDESLLESGKARTMIGFVPQHSLSDGE